MVVIIVIVVILELVVLIVVVVALVVVILVVVLVPVVLVIVVLVVVVILVAYTSIHLSASVIVDCNNVPPYNVTSDLQSPVYTQYAEESRFIIMKKTILQERNLTLPRTLLPLLQGTLQLLHPIRCLLMFPKAT